MLVLNYNFAQSCYTTHKVQVFGPDGAAFHFIVVKFVHYILLNYYKNCYMQQLFFVVVLMVEPILRQNKTNLSSFAASNLNCNTFNVKLHLDLH